MIFLDIFINIRLFRTTYKKTKRGENELKYKFSEIVFPNFCPLDHGIPYFWSESRISTWNFLSGTGSKGLESRSKSEEIYFLIWFFKYDVWIIFINIRLCDYRLQPWRNLKTFRLVSCDAGRGTVTMCAASGEGQLMSGASGPGDGQLMSGASGASGAPPSVWLSTHAVQLTVPVGYDGQLMSGACGASGAPPIRWLSADAVQLTVPIGDDGQLMCGASGALSILWLSTDAVQLAVPIFDDGQLTCGASGASGALSVQC